MAGLEEITGRTAKARGKVSLRRLLRPRISPTSMIQRFRQQQLKSRVLIRRNRKEGGRMVVKTGKIEVKEIKGGKIQQIKVKEGHQRMQRIQEEDLKYVNPSR